MNIKQSSLNLAEIQAKKTKCQTNSNKLTFPNQIEYSETVYGNLYEYRTVELPKVAYIKKPEGILEEKQ